MRRAKGSWGYHIQGSDQMLEVHELGTALSLHLSCKAVHWPAFGKNLYECVCGVVIPLYMAKAAVKTNNWSMVEELHTRKEQKEHDSK